MIRQPTTILLLAPFPDFSMMIGMLEAIKTWTVVGMTQIPVHMWDHIPIACTVVKNVPEVVLMFVLQTSAASDLALFPGLLHLQFLIVCSVIIDVAILLVVCVKWVLQWVLCIASYKSDTINFIKSLGYLLSLTALAYKLQTSTLGNYPPWNMWDS